MGNRISAATLLKDADTFRGTEKRKRRNRNGDDGKLTADTMLRDNAAFKRKQAADEEQAIKDYEKQASIMDMAIDMARNGMAGDGYRDPVSLYARNMAQRAVDRTAEDKGRQLAASLANRGIRTELQEKMKNGILNDDKNRKMYDQIEESQENERKFMSQFKNKEDYDIYDRGYNDLNYDEIQNRIKEAENKTGGEAGFALVGNKDKQDAAYDARLLRIAAERAKTSADVKKEIDAAKAEQQSAANTIIGQKMANAANASNGNTPSLVQIRDARKTEEDARKAYEDSSARIKELEKEYGERKADEDYAARKEYYESIPAAEDFEEYLNKGAADARSRLRTDEKTANEVNDELNGRFFTTGIPGKTVPQSTASMERAIRKVNDNTENDPTAVAMLDDDEKGIYSYLLGKYGEDRADEYIRFKMPELNERAGEIVARNKEGMADKLLYAAQSVENAGDDIIKGINMLTGDEAVPASRREYAVAKIKEDLDDTGAKVGGRSLGNIAFDAVETTANMVPAIAAGNGAGNVLMGITAGSRAANEAWREGSTKGEAAMYGAANGILEATMQKYLGGISRLGGKLSGITKDVISSKVKSTLGKALINMGVTSLSEGSEEYLQEIIDPIVQNVILGKDNEIHFVTEDALYAGFLGAITGNVFEAGTNIKSAATDSRTNKIYEGIGKNTNDNQKSEILDYAKNADEDTALKSALTEYNDNPNEANLGRLRMETEKDIGEKIGKASDADEAENMRNDMAEDGSYISDVAREAMEDVGFINTEEPINEITASNDGLAAEQENLTEDAAESLEMSDKAKFIMNDSMDDATDTETYKKGFEDLYRFGRAGISYETADENSLHAGELSLKQKRLAYVTGLTDRQTYFNERQQRINTKVNKGQGILRYVNESETRDGIRIPRMLGDMSRRQRNSIKAIRHIAEITGQNIALYESEAVNGELTAPNGWYDPDTDTIYIDVNSGDVGEHAMMRTASHEVTHAIKEWSPVKYRKLQDYVTGQYEADGSLMALVQHEIDNAAANGKTLTYEQAVDEVTANACEMMLKDSKAIEKLAKEEPSIFTRIKDVITGIVNDIKRAFEGIKGNTFEYKRMEELLDDWSGIQELWDDAFVDMSRNTNRAEKAAVEIESTGKNISYDTRMSFEDQVDAVLNTAGGNNAYAKSHVLVLESTPEIFVKEFGLPELPILMTSEHVYSTSVSENKARSEKRYRNGKNYHDLGDILKKIPNELKNPLMVIKSNTDSNDARIVIVTSLKDKNRLPVIVAMQPFGNGRYENNYIRANIVMSTYGRDMSNYIKTALNDKRVLWVDKVKSRMLNLNPRLQLSSIIQTSDFSSNLSRYKQVVNSIIPKNFSNNTEIINKKGESQANQQQDEEAANSLRDNRSNREILVNALESTTRNETEKRILEDYKQMAGTLDMLEELKREKQRAMGDAQTAEERDGYEEDIRNIDDKIAYHDKKLLELESTKALKDVISREADILSRKNISDLKERQSIQRENKQKQVLRDRIKSNASAIITMATKPTNKKHIPEDVSKSVMEFISSIDYISSKADPESWTSKQWNEKMENLMVALEAKKGNEAAFAENESIDPDLMDRIKAFINDNKGKKLSDLGMKELEDMYIIIRSLRMGINNANKMHANKLTEDAEKLGYSTIEEFKKKKDRMVTFKAVDKARALFNCDMLDAMSFFKMFGKPGRSVFDELAEGWNTSKANIRKAQEYMDGLKKKYDLKPSYIKTISGKNAKVYKFDLADGTVELTKAEIMSLHCLAKRQQARDHITGEGIRTTHRKKRGEVEYNRAVHIDLTEIRKITDTLTDNERKLAEDLQSFLKDECAEWGNEVSMKMYGYRKFSDPNYFPIKTDSNTLKSNKNEEGEANNPNLYKIINLGFTKPLAKNASNAIMVSDIFDVFTGHVSDMAQYHGMAMPVTDAMKWFNYKYSSGNKTDTVKGQMERAFGSDYKRYFTKLISDINNEKDNDVAFNLPDALTSIQKSSSVGLNMRVVIQQPTAYIRAYSVMDAKYLAKAMFTKGGAKKANKYSSLAFWKSQGYFETNVGNSLKTVITGQQSKRESLVEKSMWLAGKADDMTWGKLWNACEMEVKDKNKGINTDSDEFIEKVKKRFDEIIYETQVVDTVFTRPQIMRSKNPLVRMSTAFMSEPIKSYNMLRSSFVSGDKKAIGRAVVSFAAANIVNSAILAVWDSMRDLKDDDEKEKEFTERYANNINENLIDNLNPLNLVPYAKDIVSAAKGYDINRLDFQVFSTMKRTWDAWNKYGTDGGNANDALMQTAKLISQISGVGIYNVYRDVQAVANEITYDILGKQTYNERIKEAASARKSGNMNEYERIVKELTKEGEDLNKVIKDVNNKMTRDSINNGDSKPQEDTEEKISMYKTSDIVTEIINDDIETAQRIIDDIYNVALENADKSDKKYKYETFKKKRASIKAEITKYYKTVEDRDERKKLAARMKRLKIASQNLYTSGDIVNIENSMKK